MKQVDLALENLSDTLKSARQIMFILAGFSLGAIYLVVLSGSAIRQELSQLDSQAQSLGKILERGNKTLEPLRAFYEGPVEADSLNFASFIYALDITKFELEVALARVEVAKLPPKDRAFLQFEADLIQSNVQELRSAVGGLITQKNNRVPFESLPIADIRDLDYHKGKDAWGLYNDFSALRYALQTPDSYGFQTSTADIIVLEERFKHYQEEGARSQSPDVKPEKAGHTPAVVAFLDEISVAGYRSVDDLRLNLAEVRKKIEEKTKQGENSLKLPFLEQPIDASTLGWVVPITAAAGMLFCVFYLNRSRELFRFAVRLDAEATLAKLMYPWVFLWQPEQNRLSQIVGSVLQFATLGSPILASTLFLLFARRASTTSFVAAASANLLLAACAASVVYELVGFRRELRKSEGLASKTDTTSA